jgi:sulfatase maturation enzyme AslB (radical SAM superfamily)
MKDPIYCALAFGSASIDGGGYKSCCNLVNTGGVEKKPYADNLNHNNLIEIRKQLRKGDWPSDCKNCLDSEKVSGTSMRTIWNVALQDYDIPMNIEVDPNDVHFLDLTFSNKCNSKCITCNPYSSDQWGKEYNTIWKIESEEDNHLKINITKDQTLDIYTLFPNLKRIAFVGGEPTIMEEHELFCKQLIEGDRAKNITLSYVTNLTSITQDLIDVWSHFKGVHISLSIDGYGKVNDYIRYPFKWDKIEKNTRKLFDLQKKEPERYSLNLSHTVSIFNIIQSPKLIEWWSDLCEEYGCPRDVRPGIFLNRVTEPVWCKTNVVSLEYRQQAIEAVEQLKSKIATFNVDQLDILHAWLVEPQSVSVWTIRNLHQLITGSDEFRNRNLKNYIPELAEELKNNMFRSVNSEIQHEGKGFDMVYDIIPTEIIDNINDRKDELYPVRVSTHKKQYAEGKDCEKLKSKGIAVWWSQLTDDWKEVKAIHDIIYPEIKVHLPDCEFYASDIVTINGPSRWCGPHIDTPHRFPKYNMRSDNDVYGVQVIIPLDDLDKDTGATGVIPYSHQSDWDIQACYEGVHDEYFKLHAEQYDMPKGSILFYNTRLLHSTMPLHLPKKRSILLINYLRSDIIQEVKLKDNVWSSNGK